MIDLSSQITPYLIQSEPWIDLLWIIHDPVKVFHGTMIVLGFFVISRLFWMCIYEWRYSTGEEYLRYGKKVAYDKYMQKMSSGIYKKKRCNKKS